MQLESLNEFDFNKKSSNEKIKNPDKIVLWGCLFSLIVMIFFVIIPENNIERTGKDLDLFKKRVNLSWIDDSSIQGNTLEERVLTIQYLYNQKDLESKLKFLNNVHSVLMENKNNPSRDIWLSKIMKDRKEIIEHLVDEVSLVKNTNFECALASCKEKEQKVIKEKLQQIKAINLTMKNDYIDLIKKYKKDKSKKINKENYNYIIDSALDENELKFYNDMK